MRIDRRTRLALVEAIAEKLLASVPWLYWSDVTKLAAELAEQVATGKMSMQEAEGKMRGALYGKSA